MIEIDKKEPCAGIGRRKRTGCVYEEFTNPGCIHTAGRFVRGVGMVPYKHRYVAEIQVHGKRFRFRSTSHSNCEAWLKDMVNRYGEL